LQDLDSAHTFLKQVTNPNGRRVEGLTALTLSDGPVQITLVSLTLFNERVLFSTIRVHLFSWNGRKAALRASRNGIVLTGDNGYENMLFYLQPHAPDGDEFKVFSGKRQTAEAMHSIMDQMLPFKRLQRWSLESKESWVFGYLIGHNLVHQQLRRPEVLAELTG
jgi:hypothetical protein